MSSQEQAYSEGMERGLDGRSTSAGLFEGWFEDKASEQARERGWEAGQLARAIREDDDD